MRNKLAITQAIIKQIPEAHRPGIDWAIQNWWQNPRQGSGMRLTPRGHLLLQKLGFESYHFDIKQDQIRPRLLVLLDQRLQDPYYLTLDKRNPHIKFYGSKEALMVNLYGDLEKFLDNYEN